MVKYNKCREAITKIKNQKDDRRWRFKQWFEGKGKKYESEFGDWYKCFDRTDARCKDWDSLIYHWNSQKCQ